MRTFTKKKRKTSIICNLFVNLYLEVHQISMKLYFRKQGEGTPLIILHGLWGASENWLPIAHSLEDRFQVILPDIRNHGQSPHADEMNYEVMSDDIIELIEDLRLPVPPHIVGHSMGGKIVMALLLKRPDIVNKAIVVDIAPVSYSQQDGGSHYKIIDFMANFDFDVRKVRKSCHPANATGALYQQKPHIRKITKDRIWTCGLCKMCRKNRIPVVRKSGLSASNRVCTEEPIGRNLFYGCL